MSKGVLRNFAKFTGKHLCHSLFFKKIAGLRPLTFFKKRLWHRDFHVNFAKFLRTPFVKERLWWPLLAYEFSITSFSSTTNSEVSIKILAISLVLNIF